MHEIVYVSLHIRFYIKHCCTTTYISRRQTGVGMVEPRAPGRSRPFSGRQGQRPEGATAKPLGKPKARGQILRRRAGARLDGGAEGSWAKPTIFRSARPAARRRDGQTAGKTEGAGQTAARRRDGRTAGKPGPEGARKGAKKIIRKKWKNLEENGWKWEKFSYLCIQA